VADLVQAHRHRACIHRAGRRVLTLARAALHNRQSRLLLWVIFFALDLISLELKPMQNHPAFREWLVLAETLWMGVFAGIIFMALAQARSVTTGIAILMVQQGTLAPVILSVFDRRTLRHRVVMDTLISRGAPV
jgi:hypothetical protein